MNAGREKMRTSVTVRLIPGPRIGPRPRPSPAAPGFGLPGELVMNMPKKPKPKKPQKAALAAQPEPTDTDLSPSLVAAFYKLRREHAQHAWNREMRRSLEAYRDRGRRGPGESEKTRRMPRRSESFPAGVWRPFNLPDKEFFHQRRATS